MNPIFKETQSFNKWWHYSLISSPFILFIILMILTQTGVIETKNGEKEPLTFLISIITAFVFMVWFITMRLITTIDETGITAHFFGIPFCKKYINWNDIQSIQVVEYSPLFDYGGWGVRWSFNGWCYNVSGKIGIRIIQKNGKPFLIGTQQAEETKKIIAHYFKH